MYHGDVPHSKDIRKKTTPWPESAIELYRPIDRRSWAKLVPTFENRKYHVVSVTDPYGRILGFIDRYQRKTTVK
jgi:hypothetical protein